MDIFFFLFIATLFSTADLKVGNAWTYAIPPDHQLRVIEIAGKQKTDGKTFYSISDTRLGNGGYVIRRTPAYLEWWEAPGNMERPGQKLPLVNTEPIPLFFARAEDLSLKTANIRRDTVKTLADEFRDCLVFDVMNKSKNKSFLIATFWYRRGVGIVKMLRPGETYRETELVSYHVTSPRVAVFDFKEISASAGSGRMLAERLQAGLSNAGRVELLERRRLANVMVELGFGRTGIVDNTTATQVGKMVGVDLVVVGKISKSDTTWILNYRFVESESGLVKETHRVEGTDLQEIGRQLAKGG